MPLDLGITFPFPFSTFHPPSATQVPFPQASFPDLNLGRVPCHLQSHDCTNLLHRVHLFIFIHFPNLRGHFWTLIFWKCKSDQPLHCLNHSMPSYLTLNKNHTLYQGLQASAWVVTQSPPWTYLLPLSPAHSAPATLAQMFFKHRQAYPWTQGPYNYVPSAGMFCSQSLHYWLLTIQDSAPNQSSYENTHPPPPLLTLYSFLHYAYH